MLALLQDKLLRLMRYAPPSAMTVDNLYAYLDALYQLRDIDGPVVEIGCARGGTTIQACRFLSRIGATKDYFCFDTFGGFVREQLETDHGLGLSPRHDRFFSDNSVTRFRAALAAMDITSHVQVIQGDICDTHGSTIPEHVSVALVDVDLRDPVYAGLQKLYPKLAPGGVILVDDCKLGTSWVGADVGYQDFIKSERLEPKYYMGFGVVESPVPGAHTLSWHLSASPNPIAENFFAE